MVLYPDLPEHRAAVVRFRRPVVVVAVPVLVYWAVQAVVAAFLYRELPFLTSLLCEDNPTNLGLP